MFRLFFLSVCLLAFSPRAVSQRIDGQLLVEWEEDAHPAAVLKSWNDIRSGQEKLEREETLSRRFPISLIRVSPPPANPDVWIQAFRQTPGVNAAQWDYRLEFDAIPNDPDFAAQWAPDHIGADLVWDQTTGGLTATGDTIVVAILDGGFDVTHPDLAGNIWINRGEYPNDGLDNDENGLVDDYRGWDFSGNSPEHPIDLHGTSVAGIIGAIGNNQTGVAGINWTVKMMLLTTETVSDVIEAYTYVIDQRELYRTSKREKGALVVVTNASFGLSEVFCKDQPIWGSMYDRLGDLGILTAAATSNNPVNVDEVGDMPASCPSPFLVTVLNTNPQDEKELDSGYGPVSIDLGAPGASILSTRPNGKYGLFNGTSAATPHVSGAIALLYSIPCLEFSFSIQKAPQQTALVIKDALLKGVSPSPALDGLALSGGRISIDQSFHLLEAQCVPVESGVLKILNTYPNPANEGIQIEYQAHSQKRVSYRLINTMGQTTLEGALPTSPWPAKRFYLSLPALPKGLYFLVLNDGQYQVSKAFFLH